MSRVVGAALAALAVVQAAAAGDAHAQTRVAVMALRAPPGVVSIGVFQQANNLLWMRMLSLPGVMPISESEIANRLGPGTYGTLRQCARSDCMATVAALVPSVDLIVWGWIQATPRGGLVVHVRAVDPLGREVGRAMPGCEPCGEDGLLAQLAVWDPITIGLGAQGPAAVPPPAPPPPPPVAEGPSPGHLRLLTDPDGAEAWIDGRSAGRTPLRDIELWPGVHRVALRAAGHEDQIVDVTVEAGRTLAEKVTMRPTHGELEVQSKPTGATVSIDGRTVGVTPLRGLRLPLGDHVVDVALDRFAPLRQNVRLEARKPARVALTLESTAGTLSVASKPAGASVRVDGEFVGVTPLKGHVLNRGDHDVTLFLTGYEEVTQRVVVAGGKPATVQVKLTKEPPRDGDLEITSAPPGARVMFGSAEAGLTPLKIQFHKGRYVVRWILDGHEPEEREVEILGGKAHKLHAKLVRALPPPGFGELTIKATPDDAEVVVEGTSYGPGAVAQRVMLAGRYSITLRREGFAEQTFAVDVPSRERVLVTRRLGKLPPPPPDGLLSVRSAPPGAAVVVSAVDLGVTPIEGYKLRPGWYTLQVTLPGHDPHVEQFEAKPKATSAFDLRLPSQFATLKVDSTPPGATVFLGGAELGQTPGEWTRIQPGDYDVVVSKVGQAEKVLHVTLRRDGVTARTVDLGAAPAYLTVRSVPSGARIYLDGTEIGVTPLNRQEVDPGKWTLSLLLPGYEEVAGEVALASKESKELRFPLKALPAPPAGPAPPTDPPQTDPPQTDQPPTDQPPTETPPGPSGGAPEGLQPQAPPPTPAGEPQAAPPSGESRVAPRALAHPTGPVGGMPSKRHRRLDPGDTVGIPNAGAPVGGPPPGAPPAVEGEADPAAPGDPTQEG